MYAFLTVENLENTEKYEKGNKYICKSNPEFGKLWPAD